MFKSFLLSQSSSEPMKAGRGSPLAVGWPKGPGLPGIFLVFTLKSWHSENPLTSWQTGMVGLSSSGIWYLAAFPPWLGSICFRIQCSSHITLLVPQTDHSLSHLPAFAHASLRRGGTALLPSSGLVFLCEGLLCHPLHGTFFPHPCEQSFHRLHWFAGSLCFSAFLFFIACRTNMRRKTADTMWVAMARKEHKGKWMNQGGRWGQEVEQGRMGNPASTGMWSSYEHVPQGPGFESWLSAWQRCRPGPSWACASPLSVTSAGIDGF